MTLRMFKPEEVRFFIAVREDDLPLRGNVLASGDEEADLEAERNVGEALERGEVWSWALIRVSAWWAGFDGDDYLGACSYASEQAFLDDDSYLPDMLAEALDEMLRKIAHEGWTVEVPPGSLQAAINYGRRNIHQSDWGRT